MNVLFEQAAWEDYCYWQQIDKKILKRINVLIGDIQRHGVKEGIGKPELLGYNYSGYWSRRIDKEHRLVYTIEDNAVVIAQCRYHYEKS